jgi:hypothetical protein
MANEITATVKFKLVNGDLIVPFDLGTKRITQTTQGAFADTVTVSTSEQDLSLPTNSTVTAAIQGVFGVMNLDATNYVKYGPKSGGAMVEFGRLYPGVPQVVELAPSITLRWIAIGGACRVLFVLLAK